MILMVPQPVKDRTLRSTSRQIVRNEYYADKNEIKIRMTAVSAYLNQERALWLC